MLVLARRIGERVMLDVAGIRIEVMVTRVIGGQAWLGFEADRDLVQISREELLAPRRPPDRIREGAGS